ncbi:hypothetical protein [Sutterella sp.]|uniref:hypothetical protein n=1 Tax=Sutterella sp. TaxID=1981025 RepID=UPI0026DF8091|nr:hypothetical protein [Sutterella sp.]MDO5532878.1 hypothetical protein [Sutterella sp.]
MPRTKTYWAPTDFTRLPPDQLYHACSGFLWASGQLVRKDEAQVEASTARKLQKFSPALLRIDAELEQKFGFDYAAGAAAFKALQHLRVPKQTGRKTKK